MEPIIIIAEEDEVKSKYGRDKTASIKLATCDKTGEQCLCICCDSSEDEYGEVCISIKYINEQVNKIG